MTFFQTGFVGRRIAGAVVGCLFGVSLLCAADNAIYMAVLNSRLHQLNRNDNPLVGLFVSTDEGTTWQHRGWREYIRTFHSLESADGTIWSACGNGVLRSTDGGSSWKVTTGWEVTEVLRIAADARNPHRVYAATAYGPIASRDGGDTWTFLRAGLKRRFVSDICVDHVHGDHLLVASETGIFLSSNAGEFWRPSSLVGKDIRTVVQDPRAAATFWAGTEEDGIWRSSNGGKNWQAMNRGLAHTTVYSIAIDPDVSGLIYAGTHGGGVYRSTDAGKTWSQSSSGITIPDVHSLALIGGAHPMVFAGTLNGGLFQSSDHGMHWTYNSQAEGQVWGLSVGPHRKGRAR
jgi:photosystem II stability/assembly factor-like uncharacterized protein